MSKETLHYLNTNTLIGFTEKLGKAWHYRAGSNNHFRGPIPVAKVWDLFGWEPAVIPDTYVWEGEERTTGQVKVLRGNNGDYLGTFKEGYQAHGYREWLLNKVEILLDDKLGIGSAGLLRNGAQAWVSVEVPETIDVPKVGEKFRASLLAYTSLDGSLATTYKRHLRRVVCDNSLGTAIREKMPTVKVKHTRFSNGRLEILTARDVLGIIFQTAEDFTKEIEAMAEYKVTDKQWSDFLDLHLGERPEEKGGKQTIYDKHRDQLIKLYTTDERVAPWSGTAWGVVNAVNTYDQHLAVVRGMARPLRNVDKTLRGEFDKLDNATLDQLMAVSN